MRRQKKSSYKFKDGEIITDCDNNQFQLKKLEKKAGEDKDEE